MKTENTMIKLSEQLKQDSDSGDFGRALEGYAERAANLESELEMAKFCMQKVGDMTIRQHYAGLAMAAYIQSDGTQQYTDNVIALLSLQAADALCEAQEQNVDTNLHKEDHIRDATKKP